MLVRKVIARWLMQPTPQGSGGFFTTCCHPAVTGVSAAGHKTLKAFIYMVSQGRFELPTFPLGGGGQEQVYGAPSLTMTLSVLLR